MYAYLFIYIHTSFSLPMSATPVKAFCNQGKLSAQLHIAFIHPLDIDVCRLDPFPLSLK